MWGAVGVKGLYPKEGPFFRDGVLKSKDFKVCNLTLVSVLGLEMANKRRDQT